MKFKIEIRLSKKEIQLILLKSKSLSMSFSLSFNITLLSIIQNHCILPLKTLQFIQHILYCTNTHPLVEEETLYDTTVIFISVKFYRLKFLECMHSYNYFGSLYETMKTRRWRQCCRWQPWRVTREIQLPIHSERSCHVNQTDHHRLLLQSISPRYTKKHCETCIGWTNLSHWLYNN